MAFTFYRADKRSPEEIKRADGFVAWCPMWTVEHARLLVKKATGQKNDKGQDIVMSVFPPNFAATYKDWEIKTLQDVKTNIISSKNQTSTPQVSTAPTEDCGGQGNGPEYTIYKIEYRALSVLEGYEKKISVKPKQPADFPKDVTIGVKVLMDKPNLDGANTIAVQSDRETAFLTKIRLINITEYKRHGGDWAPMRP